MTAGPASGLSERQRAWVVAAGTRYWPRSSEPIEALARHLPRAGAVSASGAQVLVTLSEWAADIAVDGGILVDASTVAPGEGPPNERCDWLAAAWLHLTGAAERRHEAQHGPIHSYAFRLAGADARLFDRAWANRILLLLRRRAARDAGTTEEQIFGPLPAAEILVTHDVDALWKTPEIRLKQSTFHVWNAARAAGAGNGRAALARLAKAVRFAALPAEFDTLASVAAQEADAGLHSVFHVYGGPAGLARRTPRRLLIDPAYEVTAPGISRTLARLASDGWTVGLHQSFEAWRDAELMSAERRKVEAAVGRPITACRQHWLRFSWAETWAAQAAAGLALDSTLGFNDRPGFRAGSALRLRPWNFAADAPHAIETLPMIVMDSHLHDYHPMSAAERVTALRHWLGEIRAVRGAATVNWHTHTLTDAYGWGESFREVLRELR